jgi:hypothetical protein
MKVDLLILTSLVGRQVAMTSPPGPKSSKTSKFAQSHRLKYKNKYSPAHPRQARICFCILYATLDKL